MAGSKLTKHQQVNVALIDGFDMREDDILFGGLPLFHTFGQSCVMNVGFRRGAAILFIPRFEPDDVLAQLVKNDCTVFAGVPTMFIALLDAATRTEARPNIRFCISGGAAIPLAVLEKFQEVFHAPVHEGYGLTETSPSVTFNHTRDVPVAGTVGRPIWGVDVEIANAELEGAIEFVPRVELGEVVVRGHALFKGYLHNDAANRESIVDGWFRTGDRSSVSPMPRMGRKWLRQSCGLREASSPRVRSSPTRGSMRRHTSIRAEWSSSIRCRWVRAEKC
jgi:long-chain acyl-CoA synthetase